MDAPRIIHLRRPAALHVQDGLFVPAAASLDEIDRRWEALRSRNPAYFDGRIYHVLGVHRSGCGGASMHLMECAYRFHAVQSESLDLGVVSLGVKGLIERDGAYLLGRRSDSVANYKGMWEFAPGGVVDVGKPPLTVVRDELREEVGLTAARDPIAVALVFDEVLRTWEIVYRIEVEQDAPSRPSPEYSEVAWYALGDMPDDLSPVAHRMRLLVDHGA